MLANLCLSGYRKAGFGDFDDKIYDGNKLYLIDVEECTDYYHMLNIDYRSILLDPKNDNDLKEFRKLQRSSFESTLKDMIYDYQDSLTQSENEKKLYVNTFFNEFGWATSQKNKLNEIIKLPANHMTYDSWVSLINDN